MINICLPQKLIELLRHQVRLKNLQRFHCQLKPFPKPCLLFSVSHTRTTHRHKHTHINIHEKIGFEFVTFKK